MVYAGWVCREQDIRDPQLIEASLVESPKDKRCRLAAFEDDEGHVRDWFTGEVKPDEPRGTGGEKRSSHAIVMTFTELKGV